MDQSARPSAADGLIGALIGYFGIAELPALPLAQTALIAACAAICCLGPNDAVKTLLLERYWTHRSARRA